MTNIVRRISKIILLILLIQIIFAVENISQAGWWDDMINSADGFLSQGKEAAESGQITVEEEEGSNIIIKTPSNSKIKVIISDIYNILFPLGIAVTVIVGGYLGIKFMMASAEDKAKVKESLIPYVAGCIVIYGAFGIWKIVITILSALD